MISDELQKAIDQYGATIAALGRSTAYKDSLDARAALVAAIEREVEAARQAGIDVGYDIGKGHSATARGEAA